MLSLEDLKHEARFSFPPQRVNWEGLRVKWAPAGKHSGLCHHVFSYFYSAYLVAKSICSSQMRKNCIKPQHWNVICKSLACFVSTHRLLFFKKNSFVLSKIFQYNENELQMI